MKHLFSLVFALICVSCYAQEPSYTPMRLNYQFRGIKVDSLFLVPSYTDTTQANGYSAKNIPGCLIRTGSDFWMRNGTATAWLQNVNTGAGSTFNLDLKEITDNGDTTDRIVFWDTLAFNDVTIDISLERATITEPYIKMYNNRDANDMQIELMCITSQGSEVLLSDASGSLSIFYQGGNGSISGNSSTVNITSNVNTLLQSPYNLINAFDSINIKADTGTVKINADTIKINGDRINITSIDTIKLDGDFINLTGSVINTSGTVKVQSQYGTTFTAGDFTANNAAAIGNVIFRYADVDLSITSNDYNSLIPGVYSVSNANGSNNFSLVSAGDYPGQTYVIINKDTTDALPINAGASTIYDKGTSNVLQEVPTESMAIIYSDGANWYGFIQ